MSQRAARRTRLILVGAGHANLFLIVRTAALVKRGFDVTLVSPGPFLYSGLAAAILGGRFASDANRIDTASIVRRGGGHSIDAYVEVIDAAARVVTLQDGSTLPYDLLSVDVGSQVPAARIAGANGRAMPVKPLTGLHSLRAALTARGREHDGPIDVVIMGGGASACEVAGNVQARADRERLRPTIRMLVAGRSLLEEFPAGAARALARHFVRRGIEIATDWPVALVDDAHVHAEDGRRARYDLLVDATGLEPVPLAERSGLPNIHGAMCVDARLRCIGDDAIYGGGDAVRIEHHEDLRPVGVHAVRQGPILYANVLAARDGRTVRRFQPDRDYLAILDVGRGHALATRGRLYWLGRCARVLKDAIDLRWLRRHGGHPRRA